MSLPPYLAPVKKPRQRLNPLDVVQAAFSSRPGAIRLSNGDGMLADFATSEPLALRPEQFPILQAEQVPSVPMIGATLPPLSSPLPPIPDRVATAPQLPSPPPIAPVAAPQQAAGLSPSPRFEFTPRPVAPVLRDEKFQPIASPPIFTPEAMPGRNTEAERGRLNRGTLTAGLLGLVLGGGEGALRGATGYQGAAQKVLDADYQRRADAVKNRNAQGQALYADQYEAYKDDTRRVDALADNQRQENRDAMNAFGADMRAWNTENATRMRLYNNGQVNALKAQALEIAQQRANAGDMTAGANYQKAIAQIEQMGAEADLKGAEFDRKTAQQVVDNAFKERQVTSGELNAKANLTRAQTDAGHKAWQQGHGNFMAGLAAERNRLAAQRGQKQPVTRDQTLKIREELAKADATINTLRRGAGAEPDKKKKPEEYALWLERRNGAERAAQEVRGLLNEKAAMIGYRFDGAGYVPAGAPDSAQVQASKQVGSAVTGFFNVPPVTLPPAPNAPVNRGVQPTINPQAQSGNRVAPKPTATPKASTPTKTTKTAPGSRDEWRERVLAHLAKKAGSK